MDTIHKILTFLTKSLTTGLFGLDVIPAACDYEVPVHYRGMLFEWKILLPGIDVLAQNGYLLKGHFPIAAIG